jgi:hypothetical protein
MMIIAIRSPEVIPVMVQSVRLHGSPPPRRKPISRPAASARRNPSSETQTLDGSFFAVTL